MHFSDEVLFLFRTLTLDMPTTDDDPDESDNDSIEDIDETQETNTLDDESEAYIPEAPVQRLREYSGAIILPFCPTMTNKGTIVHVYYPGVHGG
jgi:hypothetical protein